MIKFLVLSLHHQTKTIKIMITTDKNYNRLLQRVISLKDNLYGVGNWKKSRLPKTAESCLSYIKFCKEEYGVIG